MGLESLVNPQTGLSLAATPGGGQAPASGIETVSQSMLYNGVSNDPQFSNIQGVLVPAGSRTVAPAINTPTNPNHRGVLLFLNVTAGTPLSLVVSILALDPVSGTAAVPLLTSTPVTGPGLYLYSLYPGVAAGGVTLAQSGVLPRVWAASVIPGNSNPATYSLAFALCL